MVEIKFHHQVFTSLLKDQHIFLYLRIFQNGTLNEFLKIEANMHLMRNQT
jgi:hypothetical protein